MGRERTASVEPCKRADGTKYYRARIWLGDGTRDRVIVPPKFCYSRERAEEWAAAAQEDEDETGDLLAKKRARLAATTSSSSAGKTCDEYFRALLVRRKSDGVNDTRKELTMWSKWIAPRIGRRPIASVTRAEIEDIRNALDDQVRKRIAGGLEDGISGSTADNVWSVLRTTFKEARGARDRAHRVRDDDPSEGHKPPLRTPEREKTFVYPSEMLALVSCEAVPRQWRETYAVATWLYTRPEELEAITWRDVDFDAGVVHVTKSIDARSGKPKPTPKTPAAVRAIPIEASLRPLLVTMHVKRADDAAPIVPALREMNDKFRAKLFREHLRAAGVTRPRLFAETVTTRQVDFRSCRDSGITWLALAKVPLAAMQRRAGHTSLEQTLSYVKLAEDLDGKVGVPFPMLPRELVDGPNSPPNRPPSTRPLKTSGKLSAGGGSRTDEDRAFAENRVDSRRDQGGVSARVDVSKSPRGLLQNARNSLPVDVLRAKLNAAIVAEAWDAVKVIAEQLRAAELADVVDLEAERAKRRT